MFMINKHSALRVY